jgi:hypothetical protein
MHEAASAIAGCSHGCHIPAPLRNLASTDAVS